MTKILGFLPLTALLLLSSAGLHAGTIVVLADSNATQALGANGNGIFFNNILGAGHSVLVMQGSLGAGLSTGLNVSNYYNSQAGLSSTIYAGSLTAGALTGVNLLVDALPDAGYSNPEILVLQSFLASGGTLLLITENSVFPVQNAATNAILIALGSTLRATTPVFQDNNFLTTVSGQVVADPLTSGVSGFQYAGPNSVTGGKALLLETDLATPFAAYESSPLSPSGVPEPSTVGMLGAGLALGVWLRCRAV